MSYSDYKSVAFKNKKNVTNNFDATYLRNALADLELEVPHPEGIHTVKFCFCWN